MLAGRTTAVDAFRYTGTNAYKQSQPSQQKPAFSQQSHTFWTFARRREACVAICCDYNLYKSRTQYTKYIFCPSEKKSNPKKLFYNNFRKVVIYSSIPDYIPLNRLHTSERIRPHIRTYNGCPWKPAEYNQIPTSKQLQHVASTETSHENQAIAKTCRLTWTPSVIALYFKTIFTKQTSVTKQIK